MNISIKHNLITATVLVSLLGLPLLASAQNTSRPLPTARQANLATASFCERIEEVRSNTLDKLYDRAEKVRDRGDSRNGNVDTRRESRLAKLEKHRENRDEARGNRYDALRAKATTDEQKEAVEIFIDTVESLLEERRIAMDEAITAFEDGVEDLKEQMQSATESLRVEVEKDLNSIFDQAEDACDAGTDVAEVRALIAQGMQTMRNDSQGNRSEYSFREELQDLREERRLAFEAAKQAFLAGLDDAKAELRAAFSEV